MFGDRVDHLSSLILPHTLIILQLIAYMYIISLEPGKHPFDHFDKFLMIVEQDDALLIEILHDADQMHGRLVLL